MNPTRQNALLLAVLLFTQLLLMAASARGEQGASLLELAVMRVTSPIVGLAGAIGGTARGLGGGLGDLFQARSENEELRAELGRLESEVARYREESRENHRLRKLLGMKQDLFPDSVGATVVTAALTDQEMEIVIDRGTANGVHADLPVVAWGGAVGRVIEAGPRLAKVRLLTDPNSGVGAIIQRSRVKGVVLGQGRGRLGLRYVSRFADVMLGDRVVTSSQDGVFPRGLGIGRVVVVGDESGVSKEIQLQPEIDFAALEEVLVLLEPVAGALLDRVGAESR